MSSASARLAASPTLVYRLYDRDDRLLYVGITVQPEGRFRHHRNWHRDWWPEVDHVIWEEHDNRDEAKYAEAVAMILERPRKNINGNAVRPSTYASGGNLCWEMEAEEQEFSVAFEDVPRYRSLRLLAHIKYREAWQLANEGLVDEAKAAYTWVGLFAALVKDMGYMDEDIFLDLVDDPWLPTRYWLRRRDLLDRT